MWNRAFGARRETPEQRHERIRREDIERLRAAQANLRDIGRHQREASRKREEKLAEKERKRKLKAMEQADAIERGHMVLERRELDKILKPILLKQLSECTAEENGMAEELQYRIDVLDQELSQYTKGQLSRFVRAYKRSTE